MAPVLLCPDCGTKHPLDDVARRSAFPCSGCGRTLKVPAQAREMSAAPADGGAAAAPPPAAAVRRGRPAPVPPLPIRPHVPQRSRRRPSPRWPRPLPRAAVAAPPLGPPQGMPALDRRAARSRPRPRRPRASGPAACGFASCCGSSRCRSRSSSCSGSHGRSALLTTNEITDVALAEGWGRFWPIVRLLPFVALVTALFVTGGVYGLARLAPAAARQGAAARARPREAAGRSAVARRSRSPRSRAGATRRRRSRRGSARSRVCCSQRLHEQELVGLRTRRAATPRSGAVDVVESSATSVSSSTTRPCASTTPAFVAVDHEPLRAAERVHRALPLQRLRERGEAIARRRGLLEPLGFGEPVHARFERRAQQRRVVVAAPRRTGVGERRVRRPRSTCARHGHVATPSCAGTHGGPQSSTRLAPDPGPAAPERHRVFDRLPRAVRGRARTERAEVRGAVGARDAGDHQAREPLGGELEVGVAAPRLRLAG